MIYLDNAATSWPKPESVYRALDKFLRESGGNPGRGGHSLAAAASRTVDNTRRLVSRLINSPEVDRIIFTQNCTDSLNIAMRGLLKPGDHVITSMLEHNSVVRPLTGLTGRGVKVTRISPEPESGFISPEKIEEAILPQTRLIEMIHASNVNGVIQPVGKYGMIARKYDLVFLVDAAQTAGKYPIDVQVDNIDLLAFSGHKGLFGPPGTGVLYIGDRVELDSLREGGTGSQSELEEQPSALPYKFESGTLNTLGIAGLGTGLEFIFQESVEAILKYENLLAERFTEGISQNPDIILYGNRNTSEGVPVVSLNIKEISPGEVATILDTAFDIKVRAGLHCAPLAHRTLGTFPEGTVRLSPGYFNTVEEINFTVKAINEIARKTDRNSTLMDKIPESGGKKQ